MSDSAGVSSDELDEDADRFISLYSPWSEMDDVEGVAGKAVDIEKVSHGPEDWLSLAASLLSVHCSIALRLDTCFRSSGVVGSSIEIT